MYPDEAVRKIKQNEKDIQELKAKLEKLQKRFDELMAKDPVTTK